MEQNIQLHVFPGVCPGNVCLERLLMENRCWRQKFGNKWSGKKGQNRAGESRLKIPGTINAIAWIWGRNNVFVISWGFEAPGIRLGLGMSIIPWNQCEFFPYKQLKKWKCSFRREYFSVLCSYPYFSFWSRDQWNFFPHFFSPFLIFFSSSASKRNWWQESWKKAKGGIFFKSIIRSIGTDREASGIVKELRKIFFILGKSSIGWNSG